MISSNSSAVPNTILFLGLTAFVLFFGAYEFIAPWSGDIHVYIAAVHSLYRDMWNPSDVSLDVESANSYFFSPYLVLVALVGKTLGVSPYRALEIAGIVNLGLYASAIAVFCRTFSAIPKSPLPPLLFLAVSLFFRSKAYSWSSETSYLTLSIIQAYPSLLGWALALFSFTVMERVARNASALSIIGLSLLIGLLIRVHPITATWTIGIVGLRALYLAAPPVWRAFREATLVRVLVAPLAPSLWLLAALVLGVGLSFLWPYSSPLVLFRFGGIQENAPFGSDPFGALPAVYFLAVVGVALSSLRRSYRFWILAFVATFGALEALRSVGIAFADRYVFFMGFFAQFIVADCVSVAATQFFSGPKRTGERPYRVRAVSAMYLALFVIAGYYYAPIVRAPIRSGILMPQAWREGRSAESAYYAHWEPLRAVLHPGDIAMMPASWDAGFDLPAVTGAKVIAAAMMVGVPESADRTRSVERFFAANQEPAVRVQELKRWKATKVVLTAPVLDLATEMQALLGPPVWRDETRIIFTVPPRRLAIE